MKKNVLRAQIAVNNALFYQFHESFKDMPHVFERLVGRKMFFRQKFFKISTFTKLQYNIKLASGLQKIKIANNIGGIFPYFVQVSDILFEILDRNMKFFKD